MIDQHYTPPWLAEEMARLLPGSSKRIADFCAGEGALLEAAEAWNPRASIYATDVDLRHVRRLQKYHASWHVGQMDALSQRSRSASGVFQSEFFDAVLLNPPFSYRGGAGALLKDQNGKLRRVSPSLAFLDMALASLAQCGSVIALLPVNALHSERDQWWRVQSGAPTIEVLDVLEPRKFPSVVARIALVRARRGRDIPELSSRVAAGDVKGMAPDAGSVVTVVRGRVPVHVARSWGSGEVPYVHTTNLGEKAGRSSLISGPTRLASTGPFVLLPRVGRFHPERVAVWSSPEPIILSDCVFGLRPGADLSLSELRDAVAGGLSRSYGGSCAPYLTRANLIYALRGMGFSPVSAPASS